MLISTQVVVLIEVVVELTKLKLRHTFPDGGLRTGRSDNYAQLLDVVVAGAGADLGNR